MIADRVRMRKVKNREVGVGVEVTIHILNGFQYLDVYVGDGTVDPYGNPDVYEDGGHYTLVHTSNGNETITLMIEEGSYITVGFMSIYGIPFSSYYTSLDSTHINLIYPIAGGNIHITENMEIYYGSVDGD